MKNSIFLSLFSIIILTFSCQNNDNENLLSNCCGTPYLEEELGDGKLYLANIFTPDGDGHNDMIYVQTNNDIALVNSFIIKNESDEIVFSINDVPPNDSQYGWNGAVDSEIKRGVYKIELSVSNTNGEVGFYESSVCCYPCNSEYPSGNLSPLNCAAPFQHNGDGTYTPLRTPIYGPSTSKPCFEY